MTPYYSTDVDYYGNGVIDWRDLEIMCDYWLAAAESGTDFEDFAVLANAWLHWQVNPYFNESADLNGDDRIDFEDFAVLAQYWLTNGNRGSDDYYYHYDGLGSVIALSNSAGNLVESYRYDVYGNPNTTGSVGNIYFFTGREYDAETGLYYYRARYYSPAIGRFLQTDPVGYKGGTNWYVYCSNNPIVLVDPLGLIQRLGIHTTKDIGHSWITIQDTDTGRGSSYALYHDALIQEYGATRLWPSTDVVINYDAVPSVPLQDSSSGASRYVDLTTEQYKATLNFIYGDHEFRTATNNCSPFASDTWRAATGEDLNADTWYLGGAETPWKLRQSIEKANMSNNSSTNNSLTGTYNLKK